MRKCMAIILCIALMISSVITVFAEDRPVEAIKISMKTEIAVGDFERIITSVTPVNSEDYELTYTSDNPDVCIAAIGAVIAVAEGTATITVSVSGTEISDSVTVTVIDPEKQTEEDVKLEKIIPDKTSVYMERYDHYQIKHTLEPKECTQKILYESVNTSIATVDDNGLVYAKKTGNTKIKLMSEDKTVNAYVSIYVINDEDDDEDESTIRRLYITLDKEDADSKIELMRTKTLKLGIRTVPEKASKSVKWRSSNTRIATVTDDGVVTAVKEGECKIYATSKDSSSVSDTINLTVTEYKRYPDKISIEPLEKTEFETDKLIAFNVKITPEDTTERNIRWYVYGGNATIDQNGNVMVNDAGEITVRAYSYDYKASAEYKFNVKYAKDHFENVGQAYNLSAYKPIILTFDSDVNITGIYPNVFVCDDACGNGESIQVRIERNENKIIVSGSEGWEAGTHYLFVKRWLCDQYGNQLGKNIKYEFNVR